MGTGEPRLDGDPAPRIDVLHASERTRVTRLFLPRRTVIRKEPLGADAKRRRQHELAMLERLRDLDGVAHPAGVPPDPDAIVLADVGGTPLTDLHTPLAADDLVALALDLARAVAGMHRRGVMHGDIAPANVVVSGDGAPCLVDFSLASSLAEIRPDFTPHSEIAGTLAYMAPEQTGRTGRPVDRRADLYALGTTLYELATGEPPFGSGDPLRLTHDHLARVPTAPAERNPAIPAGLSDVIMHLLEKEPDRRYQSADGLVHDLERLRADPTARGLRVGEHDVPLRLLPPSRLAGRDAEVAMLEAAFAASLSGACRGVLVDGAAGVGKTALVDQLRPAVTSADGWFVAGKFDQYRRDLEFDGIQQVLRALGRLLLAEPEAELAELRERIVHAVGQNAPLLAATVPELATLLAVTPDGGDALSAQARAQRAAAEALRAVASRERPLVVFVDDLQWAARTPLGAIDLVLSEDPVEGLLLVGAYREGEVGPAHPLTAALARWRGEPGVRHLALQNLPSASLATMVEDMLHVDGSAAAGLAEVIEPQTRGNPYETVELLDALRHDGVLAPTVGGWRWEPERVRAHVRHADPAGVAAARLEAMAPRSRGLLEEMALLGWRAELHVLQAATGEPAAVVEAGLAPALEEGLLVMEPGRDPAVRFRHDRIREAIVDGLPERRRRAAQLALARRLAQEPELFAVAAAQYLPVTAAVEDPEERPLVVALLRRAADQATLIGTHGLVDALLSAALELVEPAAVATIVELRSGRHAALFSLGRLEEADDEYRTIEQLCPSVVDRVDATATQVRSLSHRNRFAEAMELGLQSLRACGSTVPVADALPAELDRGFDRLHRWLDDTDAAEDLVRPELTDPRLLATTRVLDAVLPVAYFVADPAMIAWLALEALRILIEHGPGPTLVGPAGHAAYHAGPQRGEYEVAYRGLQRIIALGEARGYEPGTSQARHMFSAMNYLFEPIENGFHAAQRAREGLLAGGDLAYAGYTYQLAVPYFLDCAPSLEGFAAEVEGGLALLRRTGNEQTGQWLDSYQWLARALRGESSPTASEAVPIDRYADNPLPLLYGHLCLAVAAAIFGDHDELAQHSAAAKEMLAVAAGAYATGVVHFLDALALAGRVRAADGDERDRLLAELDDATRWLAASAADAPDNFLHVVRVVEAERAWAVGDVRAAVLGFDAARLEVDGRRRPWHAALITERAARFHLAHGLEQAGQDLLGDARRQYLAWGATAKVERMDWAYPTLGPYAGDAEHPADVAHRPSTVTRGTIDLLGVLAASQALSSETSIERLNTRVAKVLGAMTGATGVSLLLWSDERQAWLLPAGPRAGGVVAIDAADRHHEAPTSVLRYLQRTREPLVVADATADDRFTRDPYFADVTRCALLAVPIVSRGTLQAILLLENHLVRGAFTGGRLDVVKLIAGQLAVSLDNAQLYTGYRRIADEQAALRRVATLVAQGPPPTAVFDAVAAEIQRLLDADGVTLGRYEPGDAVTAVAHRGLEGVHLPAGARFSHAGENVTAAVRRTGRPARMDYADAAHGPIAQFNRDLGVHSSVGAPIVVEGRLWGVAVVYWTHEVPGPADSEERIVQFAQLLGTAIANADSRDQLIASRARLLAAADHARGRVVRDLHDGAQQRLVHAIVTLKLAQQALGRDDEEAEALVDEALDAAQKGNDELRELAHGILPTVLTHGGLRPAVNAIVRRLGLPVRVEIPEERLPAEIEANAYFVVMEALTNVVKHAHATRAEVMTSVDDGMLRVEVRDDGIGGADPARSNGLVGMSDRVAALGGRLELDSPLGAGTTVAATLPMFTAEST